MKCFVHCAYAGVFGWCKCNSTASELNELLKWHLPPQIHRWFIILMHLVARYYFACLLLEQARLLHSQKTTENCMKIVFFTWSCGLHIFSDLYTHFAHSKKCWIPKSKTLVINFKRMTWFIVITMFNTQLLCIIVQ